jgi:hypothetical protein
MASSALKLARQEASTRIAAVHRRVKTQGLERALVRKAGVLTTAAIYGTLHRYNVTDAIGGFPWRLGVLTLAQLAEGMTKGNMQAIAAGIADASLAVYVERSIATDSLIAGISESSPGAEI